MKSRKSTLMWTVIAAVIIGVIAFFLVRKKEMPLTNEGAFEVAFNKQGSLAFLSAESKDTISVIDIEIADDNQKRAQGLMFRSSLPANAGMLFLMDNEEIQGFWMKNTYIPLDMIFVNGNKEIATIHANTTPLREWNYASTKPALYVVEVNAGFCNQHRIATGDKIAFDLEK